MRSLRSRPGLRGPWGVLVLGLLAALVTAGAARGDTGGYPQANMPCEWFPQATSGPARTQWCNDYDWGPTAATLFAGQETVDSTTTISPRGFGYRNCTDYVAFKLGINASVVHGNAAQWKSQVDPRNVTGFPTPGAVAWWGPELFGGLGHVAVVLSVKGDGSAVVGEYNYHQDGTYDARTISSHGADAFLHIRDQAVAGGVTFVPGSGPRPASPAAPKPAASPGGSPTPRPAPSPTPIGPDVRALAANALTSLGPGFVAFTPPAVMRPGAAQLVEARISRTDELAAALNRQVQASSLPPGGLMTVTLQGPDFRIDRTTPGKQPVAGSSLAVWQWSITPRRRGSRTLTLCLAVDVATADGVQPTPSTCALERTIEVTDVPAFLTRASGAWLLGGAFAALIGIGAALAAARRRRTAAGRSRNFVG